MQGIGKIFTSCLMLLVFGVGCSRPTSRFDEPPSQRQNAVTAPQEPNLTELIGLLTTASDQTPRLPQELSAGQPEPNVPEPDEPAPQPPETAEPQPEPNQVSPVMDEPNESEPQMVGTDQNEPARPEPNEPEVSAAASFHNNCADILAAFVDENGMVDYSLLRHKKPELAKLLDDFARLDPNQYRSWPTGDRIAVWLNAWNIRLLKLIVDNYPIKSSMWERVFWWPPSSIRYIDKNIGGIKNQKIILMDEEFTLADAEQRCFQKEFNEPRVFFALSQATRDGPPLRREPFHGSRLDKQLDDQATKFLANPRAFRIDREKRKVYLSALLGADLYGAPFIGKYLTDKKFKDQPPTVRAVLNCISNYIGESEKDFLEKEVYTVEYTGYDWRLNENPRKP